MTFLEAVNRILRTCAILRGDTDPITSFSSTQHNASLNLAIVATQNELTRLVADRLIPSERQTSGIISLVANTRAYALAADFLRFYGNTHFYDSGANRQIYEWAGGLESLQHEIYTYATDTGDPNWRYWEPAATKQIGFFQVPSSARTLSYEYEGSVMVRVITDTMPFHSDEENFMFVDMAARRFKFMWEDLKNELDIQAVLDKDTTYRSSKATLMALIRGANPGRTYAHQYA